MLTHANLVANARQVGAHWPGGQRGKERILAVLPFFHVFAMTSVLNYGVAMAAELVMLPRFELQAMLKAIARRRITILNAVPTIYTAVNTEAARAHAGPRLDPLQRVRGRPAAGRGAGAVYGADRVQAGGGLWPERSLPRRVVQPAGGPGETRVRRRADGRDHDRDPRPGDRLPAAAGRARRGVRARAAGDGGILAQARGPPRPYSWTVRCGPGISGISTPMATCSWWTASRT